MMRRFSFRPQAGQLPGLSKPIRLLALAALLLTACGNAATPTSDLAPTVSAMQTRLANETPHLLPPTAAPMVPPPTEAPPEPAPTAEPTAQAEAAPTEAAGRVLDGGPGEVFDIALSPRGGLLAAATPRGVMVWNYETGQLVRTLNSPPSGWATGVAFNGDGSRLAAVSGVRMVWVWDTLTWQLVDELAGGGFHTVIAFSLSGNLLAAAGLDTEAFVWRGNEFLPSLGGHTQEITCLAFTADGTRLLAGSADGTVRLFNPNDRAFYYSFGYRLGQVLGVAIHPSGRTFAAVDSEGVIAQWDLNTYAPLSRFYTNPSGLSSVAYQPQDGAHLLTGARDGSVQEWEAATGRLVRTLHAGGPAVNRAVYSFDGRLILAADRQGKITLWDAVP